MSFLRSGRWLGLLAFTLLLPLASGCGSADQDGQQTTAESDDGGAQRAEQAILLARSRMKFGEYDKAIQTLERVLDDPDVSDKSQVLELWEEVKTLQAEERTKAPADITPQVATRPEELDSEPQVVDTDNVTGDDHNADDPVADDPPTAEPVAPVEDPETTPGAETIAAAPSEDDEDNSETPEEVDTQSAFTVPPTEPGQKPAATNSSIIKLRQLARHRPTPQLALQLYDEFVDTFEMTPKQRALVVERREVLVDAVKRGLVRLGGRWVSKEESDRCVKLADTLVTQAIELTVAGDFAGAKREFLRASKADPGGIRADFYLGLLNSGVFEFNDQEAAQRHFQKVLDRVPNHLPAMNNLAITRAKLGRFSGALRLWQQCMAQTPRAPIVTHNLGRVMQKAEQGRLAVSGNLRSRFGSLYSSSVASNKGERTNPKIGWQYAWLVTPQREKVNSGGNSSGKSIVPYGSGSGFVFHKNYVMTNRHVVESATYGLADQVMVVDPTDPSHERELPAKVVAVSKERDLAILKCDRLKSTPVLLTDVEPRRSSDIMVFGFPQGSKWGKDVKSERGIVKALPSPDHHNAFLLDAQIISGNSGGPACNAKGHVFSVVYASYVIAPSVGLAVTGRDALSFARATLPNVGSADQGDPDLEWPDVDDRMSKATVLITVGYKSSSVGLARSDNSTDSLHHLLQDDSCVVCNGLNRSRCPHRGCTGGRLNKKIPIRTTTRAGRDVVTMTRDKIVKVQCPTCRGRGFVGCRRHQEHDVEER